MLKKTLLMTVVIFAVVALSGCGARNGDGDASKADNKTASNVSGPCKEEKVEIPNYGDKGKRLKNCFVEYPGEPSRQDKSYYIVEDICGQFTKEFVENALGQKIIKTEPPKIASLYNCTYYLDEKEYLLFNLEYLKIENQKKFYEEFGDKIEKSPEIPMENLVLYKGPKAVNGTVYLVLGPEKFISITPSSMNVAEKVNLIGAAAKIGEAIKKYK
ncbi:MAG TPA: hypothetical protein P5232_00845 [Candidatus Moranbacteria bacterium]|nr:hypothetical protein [Candidatus Moranbacteria bacterium]